MIIVEFKFAPRQYVSVSAYGLNYQARVQRCFFDGKYNQYEVEYAYDGKITVGPFMEDELEVID